MNALKRYHDWEVANVALQAFAPHLWHLSEAVRGLAFFDEPIEATDKLRRMASLTNASLSHASERPSPAVVARDEDADLSQFVGSGTY